MVVSYGTVLIVDWPSSALQPVQSFPTEDELQANVQYVTLHVGSNHGGTFTCLYGLRVHPAFP
jgi:hypothetical protein